MRRMQKADWVLVIIMLTVVNIMSLWSIDVSASAMLAESDMVMSNGWSEKSPVLTYHMGIYGVILSMFGIIMISISILLKEKVIE